MILIITITIAVQEPQINNRKEIVLKRLKMDIAVIGTSRKENEKRLAF